MSDLIDIKVISEVNLSVH